MLYSSPFTFLRARNFIGALSLIVLITHSSAHGQTYIPIDADALIYCSNLPNQDAQVVKYDPVAGVVAGVNPDALIADYESKIEALKKRRKNLSKLRKQERDKNWVKRFRRNYKLAFGKKFKGGDTKAENSLNKVLKRVINEIRRLEKIVESIMNCETNNLEELLPNGIIEYVEFEFEHPDFRTRYYMFGIALVFNVKPSKKFQSMCYSLRGRGGIVSAPVFPQKSLVAPLSNPCANFFFRGGFRQFPICSPTLVNGSANTRVEWIENRISTSPRTESEVASYEDSVQSMGPVSFHPYNRRKGTCNF